MWWKMPSSHVPKLYFTCVILWLSALFDGVTRLQNSTTTTAAAATTKKGSQAEKVKRRNDCNVTRINANRKNNILLSYVNEWLTLSRTQHTVHTLNTRTLDKYHKTKGKPCATDSWVACRRWFTFEITIFGNHLKCFEWSKRAILMLVSLE